jgi:hypothetical protein
MPPVFDSLMEILRVYPILLHLEGAAYISLGEPPCSVGYSRPATRVDEVYARA